MEVLEPVDINEEEYESLMPVNDIPPEIFDDNLEYRFGDRMFEAKTKLRSMWQERHPHEEVPRYLRMPDRLDPRSLRNIWRRGLLEKSGLSKEERRISEEEFKEIFPDADFKKLQFIYAVDPMNRDVTIAKRLHSRGVAKPQIIMINNKLQDIQDAALLEALGEPNLRLQTENNMQKLGAIIERFENTVPPDLMVVVESLEKNFYEKDGLQQKILDLTSLGEDTSAYYDRLKKVNLNSRSLLETSGELKDLEDLMKDDDRVFQEKLDIEEKLYRRRLAVEKYKKELEKKPVEESPEAKAEVDRLINLLDEAEEKIKKRERKLGLTTKDKIRRYLIKYGVPLFLVGFLTTIIELIINLTKEAEVVVKKVAGGGRSDGKKTDPHDEGGNPGGGGGSGGKKTDPHDEGGLQRKTFIIATILTGAFFVRR